MSGRDLRAFLNDHRHRNFVFTSSKNEQELVHRLVTGATTAAAAPATLTARHVHGQCCGATVEGSSNGKKTKKMNNDKWADTGAGPSAPTDYYEEILSSLKQRKASDKKKLLQVQRLARKGRESKEAALLRSHREAWEREQGRLAEERRRAVAELESWRVRIAQGGGRGVGRGGGTHATGGDIDNRSGDIDTKGGDIGNIACVSGSNINASSDIDYTAHTSGSDIGNTALSRLSEVLQEATLYESQLCDEREEFRSRTVDPVWELRKDVSLWLREGEEGGGGASSKDTELYQNIRKQLEAVKQQQERILEVLEQQFIHLYEEVTQTDQALVSVSISSCDRVGMVRVGETLEGVPAEVIGMDCGDEGLRESMLNEFVLLDERYCDALRQWEVSMGGDRPSGWSRQDGERFEHIMGQYPPSLAEKRRALYMDRLCRELPHKTRADLVAYEQWRCGNLYNRQRRQLLLESWARSKKELVRKVEAAFAEWKRASETKREEDEKRQTHREHCQYLYEKVRRWREEKTAAMILEAEQATRAQGELKAQQEQGERKRKEERKAQKDELAEYHSELARHRQFGLEEEEQLREMAEIGHKRQAAYNKSRVQFRHVCEIERAVRQRELDERTMQALQEREERLEALRRKVEVHVQTDPVRVLQDTKASIAKQKTSLDDQNPELEALHPLFPVHSYTDEKVTSDRRFKAEEMLREKGLLNTAYGKLALSRVPPSVPPRPDQFSSILK